MSDFAAGLEREVDARVAERNRLWSCTSDLMATLDTSLHFVDLNPAWSEALGWPTRTLIGGSLYDVLREDSNGAFYLPQTVYWTAVRLQRSLAASKLKTAPPEQLAARSR